MLSTPPGFFAKRRGGEDDGEDLHRVLRPSARVAQETLVLVLGRAPWSCRLFWPVHSVDLVPGFEAR